MNVPALSDVTVSCKVANAETEILTDLVTDGTNRLGRGSDEYETRGPNRGSEGGVLGEEAVACTLGGMSFRPEIQRKRGEWGHTWMDSVGADTQSGGDDLVGDEIGFGGGRGANMDSLVGELDKEGGLVARWQGLE